MPKWVDVIAKLTVHAIHAAKNFAMSSTLRAILLFSAFAAAFTAVTHLIFHGWILDPGIQIGFVAVATTSCVLLRLEHEKHADREDHDE